MEELSALTQISIFAVTLIIGISLHEAMHAWVGYLLGDNTAKEHGRVTLNPLAHIDPLMTVAVPIVLFVLSGIFIGAAKPVPFNPRNLRWGEYGMALVAIAGPFTNLLLALAGGAAFHFLAAGSLFWEGALEIFIHLNVAFFVFNMLPIPPLDGSRVLYVFAPDRVRDFMNFIEHRLGLILVFVVFLLFFRFYADYITPILNWIFDFAVNIWV